jgi:hypothetical protein
MVIHLTAGFLPAARCLATRVRPIPGTGGDCSPPDRRPGVPVWPCTAWGLSCPGGCPPGGGLLPRLFTLTARPVRAPRGGMFSVTLSIDRDFRPGPPRAFPRHAALWCSDFPLPPRRERPSTRVQGSRRARRAQGEKASLRGVHARQRNTVRWREVNLVEVRLLTRRGREHNEWSENPTH